jgi:hypothetical protein
MALSGVPGFRAYPTPSKALEIEIVHDFMIELIQPSSFVVLELGVGPVRPM